MNFATAKPPYKKTIKRKSQKIIKPARYKTVDTGHKRIVEVVDPKGIVSTREDPITERVFLDAVSEDITSDVEVWIVETEKLGHVEVHEFASQKDAQSFYRGFD